MSWSWSMVKTILPTANFAIVVQSTANNMTETMYNVTVMKLAVDWIMVHAIAMMEIMMMMEIGMVEINNLFWKRRRRRRRNNTLEQTILSTADIKVKELIGK